MISSCVYIKQCSFIHHITLNIKLYRAVFTLSKEESICGGDLLRGIPCSATQLCQPQTTVGLCACTLGWESTVKNGHGLSSARLYVTLLH